MGISLVKKLTTPSAARPPLLEKEGDLYSMHVSISRDPLFAEAPLPEAPLFPEALVFSGTPICIRFEEECTNKVTRMDRTA